MKWHSLMLVVLGTLAAGLWTALSDVLAGWSEDDDCVYQAGGCHDTAAFIGFAYPVWIAVCLVIAAFLFALWKQPRFSWLLALSSFVPLTLIRLPRHTDYVVNSVLLLVWLFIVVLAGVGVGLLMARRRRTSPRVPG